MMPTLVDAAPAGEEWIHELKYDGYRTQLILEPGRAAAFTRRGHDWTHLYAGLLDSFVEPSVSGPPRRYYRITATGRDVLRDWAQAWRATRDSVDSVLQGPAA